MFRIKCVPAAPSFPSTGEYFGELYKKKEGIFGLLLIRRHPDLNRGKKDLQSSALPLGHVAKKEMTILPPFCLRDGLLNFVFLYLHLESRLP